MIVATTIIVLAASIYLFLKYIFTYWWRKGFPYIVPTIPFGNMKETATGKTAFGLNIWEHYNNSDDPFTGIYMFTSPALLIRDPDLVKKVMISDFSNFTDHGFHCNAETDPMSEHLFTLAGNDWRNLRNKLSPTFTSGKLKGMFPIILEMSYRMQEHLAGKILSNPVFEMKEISTRYTVDIISNVIFGYEVNSFKNPDNAFNQFHIRTVDQTFYEGLLTALSFVAPQILNVLRISATPKYVTEFMTRIVKETIDHREKNDVKRQDFMQLLLQLRNTGEVKADGDWNINTSSNKTMTIEQCAANSFLFYIAGNETTSATMSFTLHELAHNPEIMEKAVKEIKEVLERHNGQINYDSISEVKYLDLCIKETLRKYPALPILNRVATNDYPLPNSNLKLEKGTSVVLSLVGLHRDPKYFPNPDGYDPERFLPENNAYDDRIYLPFGDGPRNCIGMRMGKIVAKCGLIHLLSKFNFESLEKYDLEFSAVAVGMQAKDGIKMRLSFRDH